MISKTLKTLSERMDIKISLFIFTVVFISLSSVNWLFSNYINSYVSQRIDSQLDEHLFSIEMQLNRKNQEIENIAKIISVEPDIRRALHLNTSVGISQALNHFISIYPFFNYVFLTDLNGEIFSTSTRDNKGNKLPGELILGHQLSSEQIYSSALKQKTRVTNIKKDQFFSYLGINTDKAENSQWYTTPVYYRHEVIGWVIISYRWKEQTSLLLNEAKQLLIDADYPVTGLWVEKNGSVLSGNKKKPTQISAHESLLKSHSILIPEEAARLSITLNKYEATRFYRNAIKWMFVFSLLFGIVIFLILFVWVSHYLIKRISILHQSTETIASGKFDITIPFLGIDELGKLGQNFNSMTRSLHKSYSTLEQTVEKRTEELKETNVNLERSNKELDDFAYVASHDLKEPLRGITNYSNFLQEDYQDLLDEQGRHYLLRMGHLATRMDELINGLLEFSRLGRQNMSMNPCNLNEVLDSELDSLNEFLQERQIEIRIPRSLPTVECDRSSVGHIFRNLISNSSKFNKKTEKWVEIGYEDTKSGPVLYVRDNGIGIPEKHQKSIFMIFKRLHHRDEFEGTGAGLTITKKIIDRHEGSLELSSKEGFGTTFYFTLSRKVVIPPRK